MKLGGSIKSVIHWNLIILGTVVLAVCMRIFIFATYTIPTPSMEPAIMSGDHVVVNKLVPGPRVIMNFFSLGKGEKPVFRRFTVWKVKRDDVLIFNFPYSNWERIDMDLSLFYAKRCVAIPGDTLCIENGFYKVKGVTDTLGHYENQRVLSEKQDDEFAPAIFHCFPYDPHYNWNIKNFGPIYIPKKGASIAIDSLNVIIYWNLIAYETGERVSLNNEIVSLGDSSITEYTFNKNYYFMSGDYVFDSQDSRYWGLLPEDHITGKVSFVWNSKDIHTGKIRWNRFLKKIK